jgi:hypothetical protein
MRPTGLGASVLVFGFAPFDRAESQKPKYGLLLRKIAKLLAEPSPNIVRFRNLTRGFKTEIL